MRLSALSNKLHILETMGIAIKHIHLYANKNIYLSIDLLFLLIYLFYLPLDNHLGYHSENLHTELVHYSI